MQDELMDLLVIGGGINGAGIAADASGRGLKVILCEKDDLAHHTSSASSKLIHGGLRYLEQSEFKLVREALKERETLLNIAPHLVHPLEFILPYDTHLRSRFIIRLGLLIYDYLGRRKQLGASHSINFKKDNRGAALKNEFKRGFSYMDCWTDDSRLCVINAMRAANKGATILTRTEVISAKRESKVWGVDILDKKTQKKSSIKVKAIVNASGAWVSHVLQNIAKTSHTSQIKLVKGSHFIVPKLYHGDFAYILQNTDQRIIFVIPYRSKFSLIGTTDVVYEGNPNVIKISHDEIDYLLKSLAHYFANPPSENDIVWSYAGVRALYNDEAIKPSEITREYHLELNDTNANCPILSVFGGKITTYRTLAEHVMVKLKKYFPEMSDPWTANTTLPGGDLGGGTYMEFVNTLKKKYANFPETLIERYACSYGSLTYQILKNAITTSDLGLHFGCDFYAVEVDYLIKNEWAQTVEDLIWRRSKLGILLDAKSIKQLEGYIAQRK